MISILKFTFRSVLVLAVVGAVIAGGTALVAGPERAKAALDQVRNEFNQAIDCNINDPDALRHQLETLDEEYPKRIGQVRGDLAELQEQMRQLDRQRAISERVVAMAEDDLDVLEDGLAKVGTSDVRFASVRFDGRVLPYDRAAMRAKQIKATRVAYANRASDAIHDLSYLGQQAERLEELLGNLESEHHQFRTQLWQLERQVDAIDRNERLIGMLERRNQTIEECSRYEVASLEQLTGRLAEYRARQEAQLEALASQSNEADYEELARLQLTSEVNSLGADVVDAVPLVRLESASQREVEVR